MRLSSRQVPARSWRRASLTLVALGLWLALAGSARRVEAGCVHDGLSRSQESTGAAHFNRLIATGAMPAPAEPGETPERPIPGKPRPCSGPSCSGSGGLPSVPTATIAPASSSWAWTDGLPAADVPGSLIWPARDARSRPILRPAGIFHPPRAAA